MRTMNRRAPHHSPSAYASVVASAGAVPLLFLAGLQKRRSARTEVTVQAEHPEQGAISEHITADAVLAPLAQAAIVPKISAPVNKFYVQRGARVKAGELSPRSRTTTWPRRRWTTRAPTMAAQAAYATATKAQVPEDALKAESRLAQAKANLDLNLSIVNSRKQLFAEGAIPGPRSRHGAGRAGAGAGRLRRRGQSILNPCTTSATRPRSSRHRAI